ncbi:TetR/AcrR family transcriptional regulator [Tropicimonas sediminicola]|uniref:Transcriptional regulator, TetR family n=1 Tax=Tropicimonas sediminicola TaxID=1031541 RepID=A0A239F603_9RHOB|nr:TetR/AcrR family transcriptional regulator [Tropicimonas sediminicola]SNS51534.1 transcriptional regulator, TetR family [Tropicimonas sediminicola]
MTLFWKKGYHATSLKDLEAALNMKPGSIYAAFSSKEGLFLEALARYYETSRGAFAAEMAKAGSPLEGVAQHLRSYADIPTDHPRAQACMLLKTLVDTRATEPAIAEKSREYLSGMRDAMTEVFERAIAAGELPEDTDPQRLARRLQACIMALRFELHQGTGEADLSALAEDMAQEFERLRKVST